MTQVEEDELKVKVTEGHKDAEVGHTQGPPRGINRMDRKINYIKIPYCPKRTG